MIELYTEVAQVIADQATRKYLFRQGIIAPERHVDMWSAFLQGYATAQCFDFQSVMDWMILDMPSRDREGKDYVSELPCCSPPYKHTYAEFGWGSGRRYAVYSFVYDIHDDEHPARAMLMVFERGDDRFVYYLGAVHVDFDEHGAVARTMDGDGRVTLGLDISDAVRSAAQPAEARAYVQEYAGSASSVVLFAFSLLHCTNVNAVDVDPRSLLSRQMAREAERKKRQFLVYKMIVVKPFGSYRKSESEEEGEGHRKRLHLVRGHFMEFGPEYGKGLAFGRIAGRFYCPPHARGELNEGIVSKTYKLAAPEKVSARV